jgi:hypothetical protein
VTPQVTGDTEKSRNNGSTEMFRVHLTNMGYSLPGEWSTMKDAILAARRAGFEAAIREDWRTVAVWSPIGGLRRL